MPYWYGPVILCSACCPQPFPLLCIRCHGLVAGPDTKRTSTGLAIGGIEGHVHKLCQHIPLPFCVAALITTRLRKTATQLTRIFCGHLKDNQAWHTQRCLTNLLTQHLELISALVGHDCCNVVLSRFLNERAKKRGAA